MKAIFNISHQKSELTYERHFQKLFEDVEIPLRHFVAGEEVKHCEPHLRDGLVRGIRLIERLASAASTQATSTEVEEALELASFASRYLALDQQSAALFARVILSLAQISLCPCPKLRTPLPRTEEFLNGRSLPAAVHQLYDSIRKQGTHTPYLSTFQMYELWMHLVEIRSSSPEFNALVSVLDAHTIFFRATMANLARMDITSGLQKFPAS